MQEARKRSVLILLTNSFAVINLIQSGLIKALARHYNIHLLTTMIDCQALEKINNHYNTNIRLVPVTLPPEGTLLSILRKVEKALFAHRFDIVTQNIKYKSLAPMPRLVISICLKLLALLHLEKPMLITIRKLIIYVTSFTPKLKQLLPYRFDGVISSSPLDLRENRVVNFLGRHGVRSLAMIISWDNLTSKGVVNAHHSSTLVWNEVMADEFRQFYACFYSSPLTVKVVGIPRFDIYFKSGKIPISELKRRFKICEKDCIILIATSAFKHFPNQLEIVKDVLQYAESEGNIHVFVRCHPADCYICYQPFEVDNRVTIWHPGHIAADKMRFYEWLPALNFLDSLDDMLRMCDICIQFASTMRLDAAACGKPVISIAYDAFEAGRSAGGVKRLYDYSHQLPLNQVQADTLVTSKQQLFDALKNSLAGHNANINTTAMKPFLHFSEDKSVRCTVKAIAAWLD